MFWLQEQLWKTINTRHPPTKQAIAVVPSSDLWDLILDMKWDQVLHHVQEHPHDAEWSDGHWHETPLYLACQHNAPLNVIRALVLAYPPALWIPSGANKDLPIHIACRYQVSDEILNELLKDYPATAVEQTRWGRTPMMALWDFRPTETSSSDNHDHSGVICPHLWTKMQVILEGVAKFRQFSCHQNEAAKTSIKECCEETFDELCQDAAVMNASVVDSSETLLIVHAAVSLGALSCPIEVLEYALRKFPEQAHMEDPWGKLPLHLAVGPSSWNSSTRRQYKPREEQFISLLLSVNPAAAKQCIANDNNRFPLHSALVNRHTWRNGVESLFRAAPDIVLIQDPVTKLYPFQLAAIPVRDNKVDLDTVYSLLRSRPDVLLLMDLTQEQPPKQSAKTNYQANDSIRSLELCPREFQDVLLGTAAAISIGSVAGVLFGASS